MERRERSAAPLPVPSSSEHAAFVTRAYAAGRATLERGASANPYALLPDTLAFLEQLLAAIAPHYIVELGSGESTHVFARWLAPRGGHLVSVEHDRGWVSEVTSRLPAEAGASVRLVHAPLRLTLRGGRLFLGYGGLERLAADVGRAQLVLLDGPHISGRELALYFVLSHCAPGAVIVVDDFRHYSVRDMLLGLPPSLARCFVGHEIDENTHGLYVLRCARAPVPVAIPSLGLRATARSYWRCLRDYSQHGTGA